MKNKVQAVIDNSRSLLNSISDDVEDYPDISAHRMIVARCSDLEKALEELEQEINPKHLCPRCKGEPDAKTYCTCGQGFSDLEGQS
jgi:hypothetical protein